MGISRPFPLALGVVSIVSGIAMLAFDILFAFNLSDPTSPNHIKAIAIIAATLGLVAELTLVLLLARQIRYRHGGHIQDFGHGPQYTYILVGVTAFFGLLSVAATALLMGSMEAGWVGMPISIAHTSVTHLTAGGFIAWAIFLVSSISFAVCIVIIQRKDLQRQIRPYHLAADLQVSEVPGVPQSPGKQDNNLLRGNFSLDSRYSPSLSGRSHTGSDNLASVRSSLSQVVRPITSRSRLITSNKIPKLSPLEPLDSSHRDVVLPAEDDFDSWDTSAVDPHARHVMESASGSPAKFLETIPASPTPSRSPSPGFPLDLIPPKATKARKRSRSHSPAPASPKLSQRSTRTISPAESMKEANIHPLFRTDSPTPPPAATPGTRVEAAPGAGQVISDRKSIRSLKRVRSGSLPAAPMIDGGSLEIIRQTIIRKELEDEELRSSEEVTERSLTPPIPDWILGQGPRSSLSGYNARRQSEKAGGATSTPDPPRRSCA